MPPYRLLRLRVAETGRADTVVPRHELPSILGKHGMKNSAHRGDNEFEKRWTALPANAAETNISGRMAANVTMFKVLACSTLCHVGLCKIGAQHNR
jgi:hypothetical protein